MTSKNQTALLFVLPRASNTLILSWEQRNSTCGEVWLAQEPNAIREMRASSGAATLKLNAVAITIHVSTVAICSSFYNYCYGIRSRNLIGLSFMGKGVLWSTSIVGGLYNDEKHKMHCNAKHQFTTLCTLKTEKRKVQKQSPWVIGLDLLSRIFTLVCFGAFSYFIFQAIFFSTENYIQVLNL